MKKLTCVAAGAVLALSLSVGSVANAADNRGYKEALEECFWGLLFPDEDQRGISLALNVVSGALGTYAYSSATMTPDTFCADKKASTAKFINESYPRLAEDVTRGEGEFLKTAMNLAGCYSAHAQAAVTNDMRQDLAGELSTAAYNQLAPREKALRMFTSMQISADGNCPV